MLQSIGFAVSFYPALWLFDQLRIEWVPGANIGDSVTPIPLKEQVLQWFRETHHIHITPFPTVNENKEVVYNSRIVWYEYADLRVTHIKEAGQEETRAVYTFPEDAIEAGILNAIWMIRTEKA